MKTKLILLCMIALAASNMAVAQTDSDRNFEVKKQLDVFNSIYKNLDMMYVDTLDAKEVIGTGIKAMLRSLDPYTEYYPEENMKELKEMYTGKFAGIGAIIRYNSQIKRVVIDEPYKDMPADKAGLRKGDIILAIDDSSMVDKNVTYVSNHLRGDPGTTSSSRYSVLPQGRRCSSRSRARRCRPHRCPTTAYRKAMWATST